MHKIILAISFTTLIAIDFYGQTNSTLIVEENQTYEIRNDSMFFENFIMENNSTIILNDIESWYLKTLNLRIGENCKIIGKGKDGKGYNVSASMGKDIEKKYTSYKVEKAEKGGDGEKGLHGEHGTNGIHIELLVNIAELGTLFIDVSGGKGGDGQKGGDGGKGGAGFTQCPLFVTRAGKGGNGKRGGNAGVGGSGGNVLITYYKNSDIHPSLDCNLTYNNICVKNDKGENGSVGQGGEKGRGGDGSKSSCFYSLSTGTGEAGDRGKPGIIPSIQEERKNGIVALNAVPDINIAKECLKNLYDEKYFEAEGYWSPIDIEREYFALILSNEEFIDESAKLTDVQKFADSLKWVLTHKYSFRNENVRIESNVSNNDFTDIINTIEEDQYFSINNPENTNLLIYIISHGSSNNKIVTSDMKERSSEDIFRAINKSSTLSAAKNILYIEDICFGSISKSNSEPLVPNLTFCNVDKKKSRISVSSASGDRVSNLGFTKDFINQLNYLVGDDFIAIDDIFSAIRSSNDTNRTRFKTFDDLMHNYGGTFFFIKRDFLIKY